MPMLQYYKIKRPVLPNTNGPLARVVPSSSIVVANEVVKNVISESTAGTSEGLTGSLKEWGPYVEFTLEEKTKLESVLQNIEYVQHFKLMFSNCEVKESSMKQVLRWT